MYITKKGEKRMPLFVLISEEAFSKFNAYAKKHKIKKQVLIEKMINEM